MVKGFESSMSYEVWAKINFQNNIEIFVLKSRSFFSLRSAPVSLYLICVNSETCLKEKIILG